MTDLEKLNEMFPRWQSMVLTDSFKKWLADQSMSMRERCNSPKYDDAALVLASYLAYLEAKPIWSLRRWLAKLLRGRAMGRKAP